MLERVLIPLDGSELSARILTLVRHMLDRRSTLEASEPVIELLRVLTDAELRATAERAADALAEVRRALAAERAKLGAHAEHARVEVLVGDPTAGILAEAARFDATLIAMTTHGRTGKERWIRGSVAERVLRRARAPLLLANPWSLGRGELPLRRIFVPMDGSILASRALDAVQAIAGAFQPELVLFQAVPVDAPATAHVEAADFLAATAKRFGGPNVTTRVVRGEPADAILEAVRESGADLVALTTHGRSGVPRWAFGSVAETVVHHCPTPLLVIPAQGRIETVAERNDVPEPSISER